MAVIEIPDDQAAMLKAKAAAQGLSLEGWFRKLAEPGVGVMAGLDWPRCPAVESVPGKVSGMGFQEYPDAGFCRLRKSRRRNHD